jgi:hypothetical protein
MSHRGENGVSIDSSFRPSQTRSSARRHKREWLLWDPNADITEELHA